MVEPLYLRDLAWAVTALLQVIALFFIFRQKLFHVHPAFSAYILATFLQSCLIGWVERQWGLQSIQYFDIAWGMQAVVICARWLAVMEVAKQILAGYSGIWKLASSILFVLCLAILIYALALAQYRWTLAVLSADRAVELSIAGFVVGMLIFARYYRLGMTDLERQLAIGFALFSCSWVISNSLYESSRNPSNAWWDFFQIVAFLATLVIWANALRKPIRHASRQATAELPPEKLAQLSLEANTRLRELNDRLNHLLHSKDSRT
jgi:hypothetical protein